MQPLIPSIFGLIGVVLGSLGTFIGQWLTRRQNSVLSVEQQRANLRADRREAIHGFIKSAATAKSYRENAPSESRHYEEVIADLWFHASCIQLVCSSNLSDAAGHYMQLLIVAVCDRLGVDDYETVSESETKIGEGESRFFELAREELYAPIFHSN